MASNLPLQLRTFVRRERELVELRQLLQDVRLLTLVGAGGIGKTRLALELAAEVDRAEVPDGVWLVELASLHAAAHVAQAVAGVLDVREREDRPLVQAMCDALRRSELTLIFDIANTSPAPAPSSSRRCC